MTKAETRKLDKLLSELVRKRGFCEKCANRETLQAAHIFSRNKRSVRWDYKLNVLCLCAKCHFWAHANPILFTELVRKHLGKTKYELIKKKARQIARYLDYETIKFALENEIEKYS